MRKRSRVFICLALSFQFWSAAHAAASDDYRRGVAAFSNGQYAQALQSFLEAQRGGLNTVTLKYNLGSTYYLLGNLDAALAHFGSIADDAAWGPLAHYNMGLIEESRNRKAAALDHYRIAYDRSQSSKVRALAAAKLEALSASASTPADRSWNGQLSVGGGHDDNVLLSDNQTALAPSNQTDFFSEARAYASRYISGGFEDGWRLDLGGYYRHYFNLNDYNSGVANAQLEYTRLFANWYLQSGGKVEMQASGDQLLATVGTYRLQGMHATGPVVLRIGNDLSYFKSGADYDFLDGWQNRSGFDLTHRSSSTRLRLGYELEVNHRKDNAFGNEFTSYSPFRHRLFADVRQNIGARVRFDGRLEYRSSRYRDANVQLDSNSAVITGKRKDDRLVSSLLVQYMPQAQWALFAGYQHANNDSNFGQYAYGNNQISLGVEWSR